MVFIIVAMAKKGFIGLLAGVVVVSVAFAYVKTIKSSNSHIDTGQQIQENSIPKKESIGQIY